MYPKSNLKLGTWKATCDRCGFDFHADQLKKTWNNYYVCKKCYEPREELDFLRGIPDDPSVPWVRKDGTDFTTGTVGDADKSLTIGVDDTTQTWSTALTANRACTLNSVSAKAGDVFNIYRTNSNAFTLSINSDATPIRVVTNNSLTNCRFNGTSWEVINVTALG